MAGGLPFPQLSGNALGITPAAQPMAPPGQPMAAEGAPAPGGLPQGATVEDGKVWVAKGDKYLTIPVENLDRASKAWYDLRIASPQEVAGVREQERVSREPGAQAKAALEHFGVGLANAVAAPGRGLAAGLSVGAGALGLNKTEEALQDFARDAGGEALAKDIAYLGGGPNGVEAENRFVRAYQAREQAFPLTAGIARTAGLLVPAIVTGGAAGLAGAAEGAAGGAAEAGLASRLASAILSPSGAQQAALGGAVQGLGSGLAAPFETMEDTPISREAILASGAMGALLGGAFGGVVGAATKYAPAALRRAFGKDTQAAAEAELRASLPDAIQQLAEGSPAQRELYQSIVDKGQLAGRSVHEMADRIESAVAKAGPNPEAKALAAREAAESEIRRVGSQGRDLLPSEWRSADLGPDDLVRNRDVLKVGARNEIAERLDSVLTEGRDVMDHLRNFEVKRPLVAKNLADLTPDQQTAAIGNSLSHVRAQRAAFEQMFDGADALRPNRATESLGFSLNEAEQALQKADSAADAYVAIDRLRRETDKWISPLTRQTTSTSAGEAFEGRQLLSFTEGQYENARRFLADSDTWGKQGRLQQAVNQAWADDIAAEGRVTKLGAFMSRDVPDRYGRQVSRVDPDKIERYLEGLGKKTLPDQDLQAMLETKSKLMREVAAAYEIPAERVAAAIKSTEELSGAVKKANELMTATGGLETQLGNILQSRLASIAGHAVGALGGGMLGGVPGALVGHSVGAAVEEYAATKVPQIMRALTGNQLGFGKLPEVYQRALNRQAIEAIPAAARPLFRAIESSSRAEQLEQYDKRTDVLAKLATSPDALMAAAAPATARYDMVKPGMGTSAQIAAQERVARLQAAWPGKQDPGAHGKAQTTASSEDIRLANAMWEATTQPFSTLEDFSNGDVDPDKVTWTWLQYPELQKLFQAAAVDSLQSIPDDVDIPHDALAQLDMFLGFGGALDGSQSPQAMATAMGLAMRQRAETNAGQPRPVNARGFQTRVNQIAGVPT